MTGNDVLRQALSLLNYTDTNGNLNAANNANLNKRSLPLINQIYADLWDKTDDFSSFSALKSLNESLELNDYVCYNILPYGVAMLLAQSDGDADNQALYSSIYNQRRPAAFSRAGHIQDVLPRTYL